MRFLAQRIALSILLAYSLYHSVTAFSYYLIHIYRERAVPDPITAVDERLRPLKTLLPTQERIGYITDIPEEAYAEWFEEYLRTQYALAPTILDNSTDPLLVVASLRDPSSLEHIIREKRLSLIAEGGHGAFLLSRHAP